MNIDQVKGNWSQLVGKAREQWGELTEDEVMEARGEREQLVGKIQAKYGKTREEAEQEFDKWVAEL
ncbi:CsbD family protein [Primorskyibacter sp. 2E107]|uniref:CsbD family protein n=1 Tax=Primorskyibacter sp. 2E107 TaxID=3403458 RepID=UPI003AF94B0C